MTGYQQRSRQNHSGNDDVVKPVKEQAENVHGAALIMAAGRAAAV